jgi:hypothetical protein
MALKGEAGPTILYPHRPPTPQNHGEVYFAVVPQAAMLVV